MVSHGIGVRYSARGARIIELEHSEEKYVVTGMATGHPGENLESFIAASGLSLSNGTIACGLCPGDYISALVVPDESMEPLDIRDQLDWEINRKMISDHGDYMIDYAISDIGFAFAALKSRIKRIKGSLGRVITDVETVALFNGCDAAGEIGSGVTFLVSVEAEGISSVLLDQGELVAMESYAVREDELAAVIPVLDRVNMNGTEKEVADRLAGYVMESYRRVTGKGGHDMTPDSIVLAGGGVYIGDLSEIVGNRTGVATAVSNPFASVSGDIQSKYPDLSGMSAAFTTCFGLAVRALDK